MAKPEPEPLAEEPETPGCASSDGCRGGPSPPPAAGGLLGISWSWGGDPFVSPGELVVPKAEVNPQGDGEELELGRSGDWLVTKVKVEEDDEEWATAPHAAGTPTGCACKPEQPCPEEPGSGALATIAEAGGCNRCCHVLPASPRPFACAQCGKGFGKKAHLTRHLRVHTGERPFPCGQCGRRFRQRIHLRSHQRTHTGERPFPCADCGRRFRKKTHVARHRRTHTGERPFACARCARRFAHKQHLLRHQRLHDEPETPSPWVECGEGKDAASPRRQRQEEWPVACDECGHSDQAHPRGEAVPQTDACPRCTEHRHHPPAPAGARPFSCELCGRSFGRKSHLARHQAVHTGQRPHACARCPRRFSSKTNLARHQAVHTGHRPHRCARCGKSFSRKTHLLRHERTHSASAAAVPRQSRPAPAAL